MGSDSTHIYFGPTKCSEILSERLQLNTANRKKAVRTFANYTKLVKATYDIKDFDARCRIINALKQEAKRTVFSDLVLDDDSKQRLYYCLRFMMERSLDNV